MKQSMIYIDWQFDFIPIIYLDSLNIIPFNAPLSCHSLQCSRPSALI